MSEANNPTPPERRSFLGWLAGLAGALAGIGLAVPYVAYLFGPVIRKEPARWVPVGKPGDFPVGQTRLVTFDNPLGTPWDGMSAQTGAYVRSLGDDKFVVFAVNCAHLGCPVNWFPQSGLFMCPCHGGVYYENGDVASGPPPRGLYHVEWRIEKGKLEIQAPHFPTLQDTLTGKKA